MDLEPLEGQATDEPARGWIGGKFIQHPNSLRNLAPAWPKGRSGNPGGLAGDGKGAKDHPIRATLRAQLAKRRELQRFVSSWIQSAIEGDSAAREQILKRLDPVLDDPAQGRQILEGLRLELSPGKATLTVARGEALAGSGEAHVTTMLDGQVVTDGHEAGAGEGDALGSE